MNFWEQHKQRLHGRAKPRYFALGVSNIRLQLRLHRADHPEFFVENLAYTLEIDENNNIVGGKWEDETKNPDFAWVPYYNPRTKSEQGSENPYLVYRDILNVFGNEIDRE